LNNHFLKLLCGSVAGKKNVPLFC